MLIKNFCYGAALLCGCYLIVFGAKARRHPEAGSAWASVVLIGTSLVMWCGLGETLCWTTLSPVFDLPKWAIAGFTLGIGANMALSGQMSVFKLDVFRKRGDQDV